MTILEESLQQSPLDIRVESQRISSSLGPTPDVGLSILDKGDESTIEGLRQVKIELRAAVYEKLVEALLTDEVDDLALALDASESGRSGTLALLSGLQRRLLGIEASPREQTLETSTSPLEQTISTMPSEIGSLGPASPPFLHHVESAITNEDTMTDQPSNIPPIESPDFSMRELSLQDSNVLSPTTSPNDRRASSREHDDRRYSPSYMPHFSMPWKSRSRSDSTQRPRGLSQTSQHGANLTVPIESPQDRTAGSPSPSRSRFTAINTASYGDADQSSFLTDDWQSTSGKVYSPPTQTDDISSPFGRVSSVTDSDDDHGFCKGARLLQNGSTSAFKQRLEFNDGWSSSRVPYLACTASKCVFACRLPDDRLHYVWRSSKGLAFRWQFLAKSHASQVRVDNEQYAYLCMFCNLTDRESAVYFGTDTLLQHLSEHRADDFSAEVLKRCRCINDCIADDEEDFDINLYPRADVRRRKASKTWSEALLGVPAPLAG